MSSIDLNHSMFYRFVISFTVSQKLNKSQEKNTVFKMMNYLQIKYFIFQLLFFGEGNFSLISPLSKVFGNRLRFARVIVMTDRHIKILLHFRRLYKLLYQTLRTDLKIIKTQLSFFRFEIVTTTDTPLNLVRTCDSD